MPSQSHGRACLVVAVCLVTLFLILDFQRRNAKGTYAYTSSTKGSSSGIGNQTLGFEKIFVINAPWRTDRKDSISIAASYSGIALEWIKGVDADKIKEKAYPPGNHRDVSHGGLGSWRAHMDAMREIVARNITTALIFEDDADWDFRIREQLQPFSQAAREIPELASKADSHASQHPPASEEKEIDPSNLAKCSSISLPLHSARSLPTTDPYGRDWDVLWLGHCGAELPPPSPFHPNRLTLSNDKTVASPKHLKPMANAPQDPIATLYPPKTRLYHRTSNSTICTLAYAVTQSGARKILYQFGIRGFSKGYDFALSDYCAGIGRDMVKENTGDEEGGIRRPMCVTVQPPLFSHFWPEKGESDIMGTGAGGRELGTRYVRKSVRANIERLVRGNEGVEERWGDD
ncbi:glycosyltransferase family 25 protein [Lentithecium fluviatile CBS 122367]|uniref:Glycosyltransferase family 25 protein n=1 Tax=Lentithecium fluviatile CBS 122367 TaxID=1168545 RepID=A0A6G1JI17_9PLEO|nr:glycosyltransferase family 25 protein [Lentithecium fluviatile CBS 122367]